MWNPFVCKVCQAKDQEIKRLIEQNDRLLALVAPKVVPPEENLEIIPENDEH